MDLSIIVPIYNTEFSLVNQCINSLKKIDRKKISYEIILIDDGSLEENSFNYEKLSNDYIIYKKIKNGGVSNARNIGVEISKGRYIMFVDSDDEIIVDNFNYDFYIKDYDIICYNKLYVNNKTSFERTELKCDTGDVNYLDVITEMTENNRFHNPCSKIIKRDFLQKNNISFDINLIQGEDIIFNINMLKCEPKIYYINKPVYIYKYDFNTSRNRLKKNSKLMCNNCLYIFQAKKELCQKYLSKISYDKLVYNTSKYIFQTILDLYSIGIKDKEEYIYWVNKCQTILNEDMPKDLKIKIRIIKSNNLFLIGLISKVRDFYLQNIKKDWN